MASSEKENKDLLVSKDLLMWLSSELTAEWKDLGRHFGVSKGRLHDIRQNYIRDEKEAKHQMLTSWQQTQGGGATYNKLAEALEKVGRKDLAEKVQQEGERTRKQSIEYEHLSAAKANVPKRNKTTDKSPTYSTAEEEERDMIGKVSVQYEPASEQSASPVRDTHNAAEDRLRELIAELKQRYKRQYDAVQPIPYIKDKLYCVDNVFVQGGIQYLVTKKISGPYEWDDMKCFQDIFIDSRLISSIRILEGDPGYGKSTVTLQVAYDWCNSEPGSYLVKFEILILIQLRQLRGVTSIYSAIKRFLLPKESTLTEDDVKHILRNSSSVLVVLDSFDEYPDQNNEISDISRIIRRELFHNFDVIVTTRTACLPNYLAPQAQRLRLTGFDEKARDYYIRKAVVGDDEVATNIIKRRLSANSVLAALCQIPLFFVMFAHMSHETSLLDKFNSVTHFIGYMIGCFHDHMDKKWKETNSEVLQSKLINHKKLDEVAFSGLRKQSGSQQLVWEKSTLRKQLGKTCYELYKQLGILVEEEVLDIENYSGIHAGSQPIEEKAEVRFYHKVFCEWFAAHHLSNCISSNKFTDGNPTKVGRCFFGQEALNDILEQLDPFDLQYLFRFSCGLNADAAEKIITHLKEKKSTVNFAVLCVLEREGDVRKILETIRDLCSQPIQVGVSQSLLLQGSTIELLQIASSNGISISSVYLRNCYSTVDLSGGNHLQLKSNLSIPVLTTLNTLEIYTPRNEGREITAEEFTGILQYSSKCLALKELLLTDCLLPQYVQAEYVSILRTRNVKVYWLAPVSDYQLNLQSCHWEHTEWDHNANNLVSTGEVVTNEDYQKEVRKFTGEYDSSDLSD